MTTKQWLSRARRIDTEVNTLLATYTEAKARLLKITQTITGEAVQMDKDPHKFDRLAELSALIDRRVDELYKVKLEIAEVIEQMPKTDHKAVLMKRYVDGKAWEEIAAEMNFSTRHVQRIHGHAIIEITEVLNGRTEV